MIACASHREEAEVRALRLPESTSGSPPAWLQTRLTGVQYGLLRIATQTEACHVCCLAGPSAFLTRTKEARYGTTLCRAGLFCSFIEHVKQAQTGGACSGVAFNRQAGHWLKG